MRKKRLLYRNSAAELRDTDWRPGKGRSWSGLTDATLSLDDPQAAQISDQQALPVDPAPAGAPEVRNQVRKALARLSTEEREFVVQFYFMGRSYRELSDRSRRPMYKLVALHKRVIRKLIVYLGEYVRDRFNVDAVAGTDCPICGSPFHIEINEVIQRRCKRATWRPVMRLLRERFGLKIDSPQTLISHDKYHRPGTDQEDSYADCAISEELETKGGSARCPKSNETPK